MNETRIDQVVRLSGKKWCSLSAFTDTPFFSTIAHVDQIMCKYVLVACWKFGFLSYACANNVLTNWYELVVVYKNWDHPCWNSSWVTHTIGSEVSNCGDWCGSHVYDAKMIGSAPLCYAHNTWKDCWSRGDWAYCDLLLYIHRFGDRGLGTCFFVIMEPVACITNKM